MTSIIFHIVLLAIFAYLTVTANPTWNPSTNPYPKVHTVDKTYTYRSAKQGGNVTIPDPYNWLEADLHKDADVIKFIDEQKNLTETYLEKCTEKDAIKASLTSAFNFDDYDNFFFVDGIAAPYYTYSLTRANENRPTWYVCTPEELEIARQNNMATPPGKKFLVEELLSQNGTSNMKDWMNSPDGKYFAYLVSESNSDMATWYIRTIDNPLVNATTFPPGGEGALPDVIPFCQGSFKWSLDSSGFFYVQTADSDAGANTESGSSVRYHRMGVPYENDTTIVHPDPIASDGRNNNWLLMLSKDGTWLILVGVRDVLRYSKVYATFLPGQTLSDNMKWISVAPSYDFKLSPINVVNDWLYFSTNRDALDGKIAKAKLDWSKARQVSDVNTLKDSIDFVDVVPMQPSIMLYTQVALSDQFAIIVHIVKGRYKVQVLELETGRIVHTAIPDSSSQVTSITTALKGKSVNLGLSGTLSPRTVYDVRWNGTAFEDVLFTVQKINGVDPKDYITEEVLATSKDGTKVPYSIVYKKGTQKDGKCTAWLHTYGSYGVVEKFYFDETYFSWFTSYECTIFVWSSVRGGGDEGAEWHIAGQRQNKTKTIEDVVAIGQDLVLRKIVAPGQIVLEGISAGGMAVAAAANKAPQGTFGVVLPKRAVLDFFLRRRSTGGSLQIGEFGDVYDPTDFDTIIQWSPLQNINKTLDYPAMMLIPADSDDRVVPAHSFKYLAQIQALRPNNSNPLLMHLVRFAGHSTAGLSAQNRADEGLHQLCLISLTLQQKRIN
ncbi:alpha/beta-hydrolase [Meira miltonrushii]|uniref:Prolyl endopeptidase n=1 Tax=Meira miltonrushii TaxID=1280837 RepID=A0A316VK21_9BASI|nr:alpha/beta-hydrolase [Meira miltonrushii]PWN36371.1 alpha/beta-hydrolase [Meira miltonrushii]